MRRALLIVLLSLLALGLGGCHGHLHTGGFAYSSAAYLPPHPPPYHRKVVTRHYGGHHGRYSCPPPAYGRHHPRPRGRRH